MKIKKNFKNLVFIFGGFVALSGILIILLFNFGLPVVNSETKTVSIIKKETAVTKTENISDVISLKIPSLKIDTVLEQVGLTSQGAVDVPEDILKAAWFNGSVTPGLVGSSVIVGHFGWKWGVPSIFNNLAKLKKGDKIYIDDDNGNSITFVVRKIQKYNKDSKVPEIFISSDGKAHLNLITCSGVWDKEIKNYSDRLVVFTDRE